MLTFLFRMVLMVFFLRSLITESQNECQRRLYTYRVTQTDINGKVCWDYLSTMSCWGLCESNEIPDWRFPFKRSFHPVCVHADVESFVKKLKNCDPGTMPGTEIYEYLEATSCKCQKCSTRNMSCEGFRYRGQRSDNEIILINDSNKENEEEILNDNQKFYYNVGNNEGQYESFNQFRF